MTDKWQVRMFWSAIILFTVLFVLAFVHREIYNDEAWIGQHVYSLAKSGHVYSELFRDCPPLNEEIVVYHKLLVWAGVLVTKFAGWGLYQLRSITVAAGIIALLLLNFCRISDDSRKVRMIAVVILLFTPLYWKQMLEFRPEMLVILCGFASFLLLYRAREKGRMVSILLSAILAGMAGLAHAFGLVYAVAGFVALLSEKRGKAAIMYLTVALAVFLPYLSGYITDRELFLKQTFANNLTTMHFSFSWWQPLVNLIQEHKRILRKPEVIGITVWFIISLFLIKRAEWRRYRFFWIYAAALFVATAMSPVPKFTRYMLPLTPFLALAIARVWQNLLTSVAGGRKVARWIFIAWSVVFFGYGAVALGEAAFSSRGHEIETNQMMSEKMIRGAIVIAPFDFVFEQIDHFTIQCWWGAERVTGAIRSIDSLEDYAVKSGAEYLIFDPLELQQWKITPTDLEQRFKIYRPLLMLPDRGRYVLQKQ